MYSRASQDDPRHAPFLDLCLLYGDFSRPVFPEAFLRSFVESAGAKELAALRRAIRERAKYIEPGRKKGRPVAAHDPNWIRLSLQIVWQREILHWPWSKTAAAAALAPTRTNIRTLQNRYDRFALLLWHALAPGSDRPQGPKRLLDSIPVQRILRPR